MTAIDILNAVSLALIPMNIIAGVYIYRKERPVRFRPWLLRGFFGWKVVSVMQVPHEIFKRYHL